MKMQKRPSFSTTLPMTIIFFITFLPCCQKNTLDVIPDNLEPAKNIPLINKKKLDPSIFFSKPAHCREFRKICQALQDFPPLQASKGHYNHRNVEIDLHVLKFQECNEAFGYYATISYFPQRVWSRDEVMMSKKGNIFVGYRGHYVIHFASRPGNEFAFFRRHIVEMLKQLKAKSCQLEYHYKILPQQNRFKHSLFYIQKKNIGQIFLYNAYGALYLAGRKRVMVYIDNLYDAKQARHSYLRNKENLNKGKIQIHRFTDTTLAFGESYWYADSRGLNIMHNYQWLNIYLLGLGREKGLHHGKLIIKRMYRNMARVRKDLKWLD